MIMLAMMPSPICLLVVFSAFTLVHSTVKTEAEKAKAADEDLSSYKMAKYFDDGSCGILPSNAGEHFATPASTSYSRVDFSQFKCLKDFHRFTMIPHCGDPWFDLKKYCAQVHFYKNKEVEESWLFEEGNEDAVLVILDGCLKCQGTLNTVKLTLSYKWPKGSFFTKCSEERKTAFQLNIEATDVRVFTMSAAFYHRKCAGIFSTDAMPTNYEQIKLQVEHDCNGNGVPFEVTLPAFAIGDVPSQRVAEYHFLQLDLDKGEAVKFVGPEQDSLNVPAESATWDFEPYWQKIAK